MGSGFSLPVSPSLLCVPFLKVDTLILPMAFHRLSQIRSVARLRADSRGVRGLAISGPWSCHGPVLLRPGALGWLLQCPGQ